MISRGKSANVNARSTPAVGARRVAVTSSSASSVLALHAVRAPAAALVAATNAFCIESPMAVNSGVIGKFEQIMIKLNIASIELSLAVVA